MPARPRALVALVRMVAALAVCAGVTTAPEAASGSIAASGPAPCSAGRVALTFDDGPSTSITPRLVRLLQRQHVPATFFMVGSRVAQAPETVRLVARAGFTIANHTYRHHDLTTLSRRQIRAGLASTRRALLDAGVPHVSPFVRPPYGAADDRVRRVIDRLGYVPVLWNVDSRDWDGLSSRQIRRTVVDQVRDHGSAGSVVLHHDGVANSEATLAALPTEIRTLRRDGYCFVGLDAEGQPRGA